MKQNYITRSVFKMIEIILAEKGNGMTSTIINIICKVIKYEQAKP
jgi:hypothetical protein